MKFTLSVGSFRLLVLLAVLGAVPTVSFAQCRFPACNQKGERFDPKTGECESGPDAITRARSHRVPTCPDGERFDRDTGQCVIEACVDGGCEARRLCTGDSRYTRSARDSRGEYGVCESSNWLGHISHEVR